MKRLIWVIGSRGLLGASVVRAAKKSQDWSLAEMTPLAWGRDDSFRAQAQSLIGSFFLNAAERSLPWSIVWAAGAAITASLPDQLMKERSQLKSFLAVLAEETKRSRLAGNIFFASSAGGVYAGASNPPFTEYTDVAPLGPYGRFKLDMEDEFRAFAVQTGSAALIGRLANLYGPGQRLDKMQGMISHLAMSRFSKRPVSIFVPLETLRDYIYADDAAEIILASLQKLSSGCRDTQRGLAITKIIASGQAVSISSLLGYYRLLTKSPPHVSIGSSSAAKYQAVDLRLKSVVWPELDRRVHTSIEAGFHAALMDVLSLVEVGGR